MNNYFKPKPKKAPSSVAYESVKIAYDLFAKALGPALKKVGVSNTKVEQVLSEIHFVIADMEGKPLPRPEELTVYGTPEEYKQHLSNLERQELMQLNIAHACIRSCTESFSKRGLLSKEEKQYFKTAYTYIVKALTSFNTKLAKDEYDKQRKFIDTHEFVMLEQEHDKDKIEDIIDVNKKIIMDIDQFGNLAERLIETECRGCNVKDYENCVLYQAMWKLDIEAQNYYDTGCPYRYPQKKGQEIAK